MCALHGTSTCSRVVGRSSGSFVGAVPPSQSHARGHRKRVSMICGASVLVVNTGKGGHCVIGYHLAKQLAEQGDAVTLCMQGPPPRPPPKPPYSLFGNLRKASVRIVYAPVLESESDLKDALSDGENPGAQFKFDTVVDNNAKTPESLAPVLSFAKSAICGASQFLYVSSCGVYKGPKDEFLESDAVDDTKPHVKAEKMVADSGMSWSVFRPIYPTGLASCKDCEEYVFDRLVRGRPVPVPGTGSALTNVADAADLGAMMTAAVGNAKAAGRIFNLTSTKPHSLDDFVHLCAEAAGLGKSGYKIVHWTPGEGGMPSAKEAGFPFRTENFTARPDAAEEVLGWSVKKPLLDTLKERFEVYTQSGRGNGDVPSAMMFPGISFEADDVILEQVNTTA